MLSRTAGTLFTTPSCKTLACQNLITRQKSGWQKGQNALHKNLKFWRVRTGGMRGVARVSKAESTFVREHFRTSRATTQPARSNTPKIIRLCVPT